MLRPLHDVPGVVEAMGGLGRLSGPAYGVFNGADMVLWFHAVVEVKMMVI